jgi:hypothetical protein
LDNFIYNTQHYDIAFDGNKIFRINIPYPNISINEYDIMNNKTKQITFENTDIYGWLQNFIVD